MVMRVLICVIVGLVALNALFFSLYMKERNKNRRVVTMVTLLEIRTDSLENIMAQSFDLWNSLDKTKIIYRDRVRFINSIAPIFDEDSLIISINQTLNNASTGNR